jgi:hypothetical protein
MAIVVASVLLAWFSQDAREFLRPNKPKIGMAFFFSLLITIPLGTGLLIPIPVLAVFVLSIIGKHLGYFSLSTYSLFGAYLFSCITFVIFERHRQSIRKNRTPLIIFIILSFLTLAAAKGAQNVLMITLIIGFWLMAAMFKIILPLFTIVALYYIAKMVQTKFRRS